MCAVYVLPSIIRSYDTLIIPDGDKEAAPPYEYHTDVRRTYQKCSLYAHKSYPLAYRVCRTTHIPPTSAYERICDTHTEFGDIWQNM